MNNRFWLLTATFVLPILLLIGLISMAAPATLAAAASLAASPEPAAASVTFIVNTTDDSDGVCDGACSLREAITAANNAPGADTITFNLSPNATILLAGTQLPIIDDPLTIDGSTAVDLTISGNSASRVLEIGASTAVTITSLTISDGYVDVTGSCPENCGAAIKNSGNLAIFDSTVVSNTAYQGGALYNAGTAAIHRSTLNHNRSNNGLGGAIFNAGPLTLTNSTLSDNTAAVAGAIFNDDSLTINNSTFSLNGSISAGGASLWNNGPHGILSYSNSIMANKVLGTDDCTNATGTISVNVNNIVEGGGCLATSTGDPNLGSLADNGGETWTHALLPGSIAIDSGDDIRCEDDNRRGVLRPQGSSCDISFYEFQAGYDCDQAPLLAADTAELNEAIACYNAEIGGSHTISLAVNIILDGPTLAISNTSGAELLVAGNGHTIDGAGTYRAFTVDSGLTTFEALTMTNGADTSTECFESCGGALMIRGSAAVTLSASALISNTAFDGGAIYNDGGALNIISSLLTENDAGHDGGAIYAADAVVAIRSSELSGNTAGTRGGALYSTGALATLSQTTLSDNLAKEGGAIFNLGGLLKLNAGTLSGNDTSASGGGIFNLDATAIISNSTLSDNTSQYGGGIMNVNTPISLSYTTVSSNVASINGGGIRNQIGPVNLFASVFANNSNGDCTNFATATGSYTLIENTGSSACGLTNINGNVIGQDPLLEPLADNGGPTLTHAPLPGSPALEKIPAGVIGCGTTFTTDQRGFVRPQGSSCDMGAVEQPFIYDCGQSPLLAAGTAELNAAIACYNEEVGGSHTISLAGSITLADATTVINNTSGAALLVDGGGFSVDGAKSYRPFTVNGSIVTFEAITITHGADASTECSGSSCGGALMIRGGAAVTLSASALISNTAFVGGAIYNDGGALNIISSLLTENDAGHDGGGIFNAGTVTITNSTISDNSAATYIYAGGGGLLNDTGGTMIVADSLLTNNAATYFGGAIANEGGTLTVANSTLSGNTGKYGGGLGAWGPLQVADSTFSGNSGTYGGAIYNEGGILDLTNSTLSGNSAEYGGGIFNDDLIVNVNNSTITDNRAGTAGGGIASDGYTGTFTTITNTIVSGNLVSGTTDADDLASVFNPLDTFISGGHNLIGAIGAGISAFPAAGDLTGVTDPKLEALADNGGHTWTHLLQPGSPALDAGDNSNCPTADQRGDSRPKDGDGDGTATCDIGAVEMPAVPRTKWFVFLPLIIKQ